MDRDQAVMIRALRADDIAALDRLLQDAYQTSHSMRDRLERCLSAGPGPTFVATLRDTPLGFVYGNDFGTSAYVALMGVAPAAQGRGIGTALMGAFLSWSSARGFRTLELDATPSGAPLYARHGFVDAGETIVLAGLCAAATAPRVRVAQPAERQALLAADRRAFGADRRRVLNPLFDDPENTVFTSGVEAYAVAQADAVGPLVAPSALAAGALLDAALAARAGRRARICVPTQNGAAAGIVSARGFVEQRRLRHMIRGEPPGGEPARLWARMNLGQG